MGSIVTVAAVQGDFFCRFHPLFWGRWENSSARVTYQTHLPPSCPSYSTRKVRFVAGFRFRVDVFIWLHGLLWIPTFVVWYIWASLMTFWNVKLWIWTWTIINIQDDRNTIDGGNDILCNVHIDLYHNKRWPIILWYRYTITANATYKWIAIRSKIFLWFLRRNAYQAEKFLKLRNRRRRGKWRI